MTTMRETETVRQLICEGRCNDPEAFVTYRAAVDDFYHAYIVEHPTKRTIATDARARCTQAVQPLQHTPHRLLAWGPWPRTFRCEGCGQVRQG